jgi:hypothetical protein
MLKVMDVTWKGKLTWESVLLLNEKCHISFLGGLFVLNLQMKINKWVHQWTSLKYGRWILLKCIVFCNMIAYVTHEEDLPRKNITLVGSWLVSLWHRNSKVYYHGAGLFWV